MTDICARCRFWEFSHKPKDDYSLGECRRRAPVPSAHVLHGNAEFLGMIAWASEAAANIKHKPDVDYQSEDSYRVYQWPITSACEWCGEFEPATAPQVVTKEPKEKRPTWQRFAAADVWESELGLDGSGAYADSKWPDDKK